MKESRSSKISEEMAGAPIEGLVSAIREDHRDLKKLIPILKDEKTDLKTKQHAVQEFGALLLSHAVAEEKVLYERCLKIKDLRRLADEGLLEHTVARNLLRALAEIRNPGRWQSEVRVLAEIVSHHIQEEETDFLPRLKRHFLRTKSPMAEDFLALRRKSQANVSAENAGVLKPH